MVIFFSLNGCGLLVGNVKPVDEKDEGYRTLDLTKENPDWIKLNSDTSSTKDESDISYQSKKTATIISLNSACRKSNEDTDNDLNHFTKLLLLGISDISEKTEKPLTVANTPALETTVQGKMGDEVMRLRTVVLKRSDCLYDLMFIARPENFSIHESDFGKFVTSLRLK